MANDFNEALEQWLNNSNPARMVEILQPFADEAGVDVEISHQKGCDCVAIEFNGRYFNPLDDDDSGSATMFLLDWLASKYDETQIARNRTGWVVALFKDEGGLDGPSADAMTLGLAALELIVQVFHE